DVVKMVKGGLPESTIVFAIQANPPNFDISAEALISRKNAGVTQAVMNAMIAAESNQRTAGSRSSTEGSTAIAAVLPSELHVDLLPSAPTPGAAGSQAALPITGEKTQLAETKTK